MKQMEGEQGVNTRFYTGITFWIDLLLSDRITFSEKTCYYLKLQRAVIPSMKWRELAQEPLQINVVLLRQAS